MCKRSEIANNSKFRIQLLSGKSLVLVEASGYESEIFIPRLKNNRIVLINVIYSRQPRVQASETRLSVRPSLSRCNRIGHRRLINATPGSQANPASAKVNTQNHAFELKIISNGNVVLVECNGYESEIFLPLISSRSVALKRVSAYELTEYASPKYKKELPETQPKSNDKAAALAAALAAQAVGLSKLLVYLPLTDKGNKQERTTSMKDKPRRKLKHQVKSAGDAKNIIFDNDAPLTHRIRPKLPVLKVAGSPNVKMTTAFARASNIKPKIRHQSGNILVPTKSNSFGWVRSGYKTAQKLNLMNGPLSPISGPSLTTVPDGITRKQHGVRPEKSPIIGARDTSSFDTVRSLFYSSCKKTPIRPPKKPSLNC